MIAEPAGIAGVRPVDPVAVSLTVGVRSAAGQPVGNDSFHLMSAGTEKKDYPGRGGKTWKAHTRSPHPSFAALHARIADGENLTVIRGQLVHARMEDCFAWYRAAQKLPGKWPGHPDEVPSCRGDGRTAIRYYGEAGKLDDFRSIVCPNRACEFAEICKPKGKLLFMLRWPKHDHPALLCKWATQSWRNIKGVLGLFELVFGTEYVVSDPQPGEPVRAGMVQAFGLQPEDVSLVGLPFQLTLGRGTRPSKGASFPLVAISPDGDLGAWLEFQTQRARMLQGGGDRIALPTATIADDRPAEPGDFGAISVPVVEDLVEGEEVGAEGGPRPQAATPAAAEPPLSAVGPSSAQRLDEMGDERRTDAEMERLDGARKLTSISRRAVQKESVRRFGVIPRFLGLQQLATLVSWLDAGGVDPPEQPASEPTQAGLFGG